jgi:hypothetical protein
MAASRIPNPPRVVGIAIGLVFGLAWGVVLSCDRPSAPSARDRQLPGPAFDVKSVGSFHIPIMANNDSNSGALQPTSTGIKFPDSGAVQIVVTGQVTVTENPNWSCCFTDNNPADNKAGSYGPNGISPDLGVSAFGLPSLHPSDPGATTVMTDTISDVRSLGLQGSLLSVTRGGISGGSGCGGGLPPGCKCPTGLCQSYSSGRWLLSSAQTITMNLITDKFVLKASPSDVFAGASVTFTASTKAGAGFDPSSLSWNFVADSGAGATYCSTYNPCTQPVWQSGTMTVTGKLLGMTKSASVHVTVHCKTPPNNQDSLLDNHIGIGGGLDSAWKNSDANDPNLTKRRERGGTSFDSSGASVDRLYPSSSDTPCSNNSTPVSPFPGTPRAGFHTHPFSLGDSLPVTSCPPAVGSPPGSYLVYGGRYGGPSPADWMRAYQDGIPQYVMDKDSVYMVPVSPDTNFINHQNLRKSWPRRSGGSCTFP